MSKGSPSPKSPYIMTRISPKSPYIMAAKSPKSPMLREKYKSGCAWGLISIFNFRQGRHSKKLISDRRGLDRQNTGNRHNGNRHRVLSGVDEKCQCVNDGPDSKTLLIEYAKENAKSLVDKEMSAVKKSSAGEMERLQPDSTSVGHLRKHRERTKSKPGHVSVNGHKDAAILGHKQSSRQISVDELLHKLDSAATTDSFHNRRRHGRDNGFDVKDTSSLDSKKLVQMNDLAEAYVNQKFITGKFLCDGPSSQSKQFLEALQILNSNKELFLKLLQDPDSLLVKHIEDLRDSQAKQATSEAKLPEQEAADARQCGDPISTQKFRKQNMRDIILKKIKFRESYPPRGVEDPQTSDEIVVLKPGPSNTQSYEDSSRCSSLQSHYVGSERQSTRPASFILGGIRRKLRHAIGASRKEEHQFSIKNRLYKTSNDSLSVEDNGQGIGREVVGRRSLSEIDSESDGKWKDKVSRSKSFDSSIGHESTSTSECGLKHSLTVRHHKQNEPDVIVETRKHFSEMPRNGSVGKSFAGERVPKTLGLPEYDFSQALSPTRDGEHGFDATETRLCAYTSENKRLPNEKNCSSICSPRGNSEFPSLIDSKKPSDLMQIHDSRPNNSANPLSDAKGHESICFHMDNSIGSKRIVATNDSMCPQEIVLLKVPSKLNDTSITAYGKNSSANSCSREDEPLESLRPDSPPLESESSTSSSEVSSYINSTKDGAEQPSPVSVLEPFCIDDISSLANVISKSAELPVQPQQISFEEESAAPLSLLFDCQRTLSTSIAEHGSLTDYVRSVVKAANLNWDELSVSLKCNSSDQLLKPSIYDEFGVSCCDHGLLFDYINEILVQVYQYHFKCSPWISFMKPKIQPFSVEEHVVHEVVKCFSSHLLPHPLPQTLERLAETDLAKSITWMDIRDDAEDTVNEIAEGVLEELMTETVSQLQV